MSDFLIENGELRMSGKYNSSLREEGARRAGRGDFRKKMRIENVGRELSGTDDAKKSTTNLNHTLRNSTFLRVCPQSVTQTQTNLKLINMGLFNS